MFLTEKTIDHFFTSCGEHGLRGKKMPYNSFEEGIGAR